MSIIGYNFNASSSLSMLLTKGYYEAASGSITTSNALSWNTYCFSAGIGARITFPALSEIKTSIRAKSCVCLTGISIPKTLIFEDSSANAICYLLINSLGQILVYGSSLIATYDAGITINSSNNYEMLAEISDGTLNVTTYLNGVELGTCTGTTTATGFKLVRCYFASGAYLHDLIIDDDPTDTIIGNCYVKNRQITSVSDNTGFTAEGDETDIPTILNQTSPDGTDYIEASADGDTITLALEAGDDADEDIRAIQMTALVQKNGDGDCNGTLSATVDGNTTSGDETALSNGYTGLRLNITGTISKAVADATTITLTRSE